MIELQPNEVRRGYELGSLADCPNKAASARAIEAADFVLMWGQAPVDPLILYEGLLARQMGKEFVISMWHELDPEFVGHRLGFDTNETEKAMHVASLMVAHGAGEYLQIVGVPAAHTVLSAAESPIERRLGVHLLASFLGHHLQAQVEIETPEGTYRVDFLATDPLLGWRLVVETDGHLFHERTKEQAARDRKRDRDLLLAGYPSMRFTGSEVWKDPKKCVRDVMDMWRTKAIPHHTEAAE